jgi:hypothetical protein
MVWEKSGFAFVLFLQMAGSRFNGRRHMGGYFFVRPKEKCMGGHLSLLEVLGAVTATGIFLRYSITTATEVLKAVPELVKAYREMQIKIRKPLPASPSSALSSLPLTVHSRKSNLPATHS